MLRQKKKQKQKTKEKNTQKNDLYMENAKL